MLRLGRSDPSMSAATARLGIDSGHTRLRGPHPERRLDSPIGQQANTNLD